MITEKDYCAPMREFCLGMFRDPRYRPPVLEEMQKDIDQLIARTARRYSDVTCPELNVDELEAEGRYKLVDVMHKNGFLRAYTRVKFFQFFATALNNHMRSLVHKYRFTEKRTGVKPPPKHARFTETEACVKTIEVRLDAEETNVQVADRPCNAECEQKISHMMEDYEDLFVTDDLELAVFRQIASPSEKALSLAQQDAERGRAWDEPIKIKIKPEHMAASISEHVSVETFNKIVLKVREKITAYRRMTSEDEKAKVARNAALTQLAQIFNLQIPRSTDDMHVRRMLTICARVNYDVVKDDPKVQQLLLDCGAKIPVSKNGVLACWGILHDESHPICKSCGYRTSCKVEAANVGLGKITISPSLLGAKQTRVPIFDGEAIIESVTVPTDEAFEVVTYLDENFRKTQNKGMNFYVHKEKADKGTRFIFQVTHSSIEFKLRFCGPSEVLKRKLHYESKCYFAPPGLKVDDLLALVDIHAKETYALDWV